MMSETRFPRKRNRPAAALSLRARPRGRSARRAFARNFPAAFFAFLFFAAASSGLGAQTGFFWEQPAVYSPGQGNFPVTAYCDDFGVAIWQEPTRRPVSGPEGSGDGSIDIAMSIKMSGRDWERRGAIGGPYYYSGSEPSILSAAIDSRNRILIAVAASSTQTDILISDDMGLSFERVRVPGGGESSVAPRLSVCADGSYLLFVTRGGDASLSLYYSRSPDGRDWSPFEHFVAEPEMPLNFLPSHASLGGREYVVFQSFTSVSETVPTFQLFMKTSDDGGRSWSPARRFTSFQDAFMNMGAPADSFDNQRPQLSVQGDTLFLVWERRYRTGAPQIYGARIGADGALIGVAERINSTSAYCNNPVAFSYMGDTKVLWFDNRWGGNRIYLAERVGISWEEDELSGSSGGEASFGRPVVDRDGIFIFWQSATSQGGTRIYLLSPDASVSPVRLGAGNFVPGRRSRADRVQVSWNIPQDSSGIQGFSYLWSREKDLAPEKAIMQYNTSGRPQTLEQIALEDGSWYFSIIAQDYAGNWSPPSTLEYIRDTTPPPRAQIIPPELDGNGCLVSNTFTLRWNPPPASDIEGYAWDLEYLDAGGAFRGMDGEEFAASAEILYPANDGVPRVRGPGTSASYVNQDDGIWRFSVRAADLAGNVGPLSTLYFRTDKYQPRTYISWVDAVPDQQGILDIGVIGRGFSQGGEVERLFLDRDGRAPYDREFSLRRGDFSVASDREIRGLRVQDIDSGLYRVGVEHPLRGVYFTEPVVSVAESGTVKFGDYSRVWQPSWLIETGRRFILDTGGLILASICTLCTLALFVSIRGIGETIAEGAALKLDAAALMTGELMPSEKKKMMARIKRGGKGLRFKLASFTIALVIIVVAMVSAPLYVNMIEIRRQSLFKGLWDRSTVLLEGLAASARAYLPLRSVLELGLLPDQMASVPEARYITITGYSPETTVYDDQVWATNDPDILSKIDTAELRPGVSRISDQLSPRLAEVSEALNEQARADVGNVSESVAALTREGQSLAFNADEASLRRLEDIQVQTRTLQTRISERLSEISKAIRSEPEFNPEDPVISPDRKYVLFKPVMYRQGSDDVFFRGLVRLEVSIDSLLEEIEEVKRTLIRLILLVAMAAAIIGVIGSLIVSSIIIGPIKKLVAHVELIRDTEDKAQLDGVDIKLNSRDELAILGNTINDMTHGLVQAAAAASDLSIGKETQKKFIPLELDKGGNKLSYGSKETKYLKFFGYYEGAKGVSGDYFDYQDLDGRYYAIIKCDVAGKGIPAALIMIQVATMFLNYFKQWKPNEKGMRIDSVVYQINEFIETLGFKGRFAAFTLCLYDSLTGTVRFCNAGDNIVHYYDASEGRVKTLTLPQTPATGVLPNFMVESKGGYTVQTMNLDHGDILLLYTDGIEEAKRRFRNSAFQEILCEEGEKDSPHATHTVGQDAEEMGPDRVEAIVNAVMNRRTYTLHKYHNPEGDGADLSFDFSSCEGKVEDAIMAMVAVEKMFRCYKNPRAGENARVLVDKIVDAFLKERFLQYRNYCSFAQENPGNDAYMYYTFINEDEQYDDLTILGIERK